MPLGLPKAYNLSGRTALITGGAGLLGQHHAKALAETGARVVIGDIDTARAEQVSADLNTSLKIDRITATRVDVSDAESVADVRGQLNADGTRVDILVNNAALDNKVDASGLSDGLRLETFSLEQWELELGVGLRGAFLCAQAFGTDMAARGGGVILNIASDLSVIAPDQRLYREPGRKENAQPVKPVTYSVIKSAIVGLTRYLASYWATNGVRVNALSPGGVHVDQPEEFVARLSELVPMARMAAQEEYEAAVQFLCSDASSYMTGQNIVIDGGRTVI